MALFPQICCTGIVCYLCMAMGLMYAWPSSTLKLFQSQNTTLHRAMGEGELALFGSLSSIGALISTPAAGYFLDILGRKHCAIFSGLMNVLAWSIVATSNRVEAVLIAIFVSGISGAVALVVPVYVSEFCQESIRGTMTSGSMIFYGIGMLVSYLLGGYLEYMTMIYVCLSLSVLGVVLIVVLKESPMFLMQKNLEDEAIKSIAFYRGVKSSSKEVYHELEIIKRALNPDLDDVRDDDADEEMKLKPVEKKPKPETEKLSTWQFFKKSKSTQRALVVAVVVCTSSIFQGLVVVQVYAEPLFEEAVPTMSPTVCSVLIALDGVLSGFFAAYLTDKVGRRALMIYASLVSGIFCVLLGTQIHLHWGPHYMTAAFMYLFCVAYTCGAGTVPYVYMAEIFLPEVKSILTMFVIEWAWLCNFIVLFVFNPLVGLIGLGPVFYIFAIMCFASSVYSVIYVKETKGLTVDQIQLLFDEKKRKVPSA